MLYFFLSVCYIPSNLIQNPSTFNKLNFNYYRFPLKDKARLEMWLKVCPKDTKVTEDSRLCDKHFQTSNFFQTPKKRFKKLNHDAVPLSELEEFVGKYHKQPRIELQGIQQQDSVGQQDSAYTSLDGQDSLSKEPRIEQQAIQRQDVGQQDSSRNSLDSRDSLSKESRIEQQDSSFSLDSSQFCEGK